MSGSADLLMHMGPVAPNISAVTPHTLPSVYEKTNYSFLFAPVFHPGMRHVAAVRKELGWRTIFNLLGPLANPVEDCIEARVVGVARRDLGPVFAEALKMGGSRKALIICGEEDLDELSCAGRSYCWWLKEAPSSGFNAEEKTELVIEHFILSPSDFGLPAHPLSEVSPGKQPHENAIILSDILQNKKAKDDPILHFVLMNTAALFVTAGVCDADSSSDGGEVITEVGPGGGRWKEGVRRARWAVESGEAWKQWSAFVEISNSVGKAKS
jgi:anthranilate phosphoribosyltransferase